MIVINLFSGPGAGKSTTAAGVFSLLKLHGVNAELVTEYAKDLTWEKRLFTLDNQYYVWAKQYHRMWRLRDDVDVIVTDSPLPLGLVYGTVLDCFSKTVIETYNEFNNMNYVLRRTKGYQHKGRNQTEDESSVLDTAVINMLKNYSVPYDIVTGDSGGVNDITLDVLNSLGVPDAKFFIDDRLFIEQPEW